MNRSKADIIREYGPFPGVDRVNGVSFDGKSVWIASGEHLHAIDPANGELDSVLDIPADAGTAFDGTHIYQIAGGLIRKLDPRSGEVLSTIPAPGGGDASGLAWSENSLWVGQHKARSIVEIDPETGAVRRTITSDRFVTGVSWVDGQLWHGTWEGEASDLRRIDPHTGSVIALAEMPEGKGISGLESDGGDRFFCGGGGSGTIRAVRRPR